MSTTIIEQCQIPPLPSLCPLVLGSVSQGTVSLDNENPNVDKVTVYGKKGRLGGVRLLFVEKVLNCV